jgi:hypothetical protein
MVSNLPIKAILALSLPGEEEASKWFTLFLSDIEGASLSFRLFSHLKAIKSPENIGDMTYHATCYVCAVRRAGRLLESLSRHRSCFRDSVAEVVQLEYKKKRAFFQSFVEPRNAIEHIDKEARDKWSFFNVAGDKFFVADDVFVEISQSSLDTLNSACDAIAEAIIKGYPEWGAEDVLSPYLT